jgi:hypothetical protein
MTEGDVSCVLFNENDHTVYLFSRSIRYYRTEKIPAVHIISCNPSERLVRAVAEGRILCVFTLAQCHVFRFCQRELKRLDPRSFMGSVTKGLIPRSSALAPVIRSRFQGEYGWLFRCNAWLSHL